jgi:hypothetical protein
MLNLQKKIKEILQAKESVQKIFLFLQEKFVCIKFPVYTENRIFSVFADGRINPWAQSYQQNFSILTIFL